MIHEIHGTHSPLLTEHRETPQRVAAIAGGEKITERGFVSTWLNPRTV